MIARHLHGFLTHAPIALLVLGTVFHSFRVACGGKLREWGRLLMYLGGISLLPAWVSGAMTLASQDLDSSLAGIHHGAALSLITLCMGLISYDVGCLYRAWNESVVLGWALRTWTLATVLIIGASGSMLREQMTLARAEAARIDPSLARQGDSPPRATFARRTE